jgi:hypothetical protein
VRLGIQQAEVGETPPQPPGSLLVEVKERQPDTARWPAEHRRRRLD